MPAYRLAASLLIALALSGCDDSERLRSENQQLKTELSDRQSELNELKILRQADIDALRTDAAVAAGCDFLAPICPQSITTTGREALARGYSPGSKALFWIIVFVKTALVGCFVGAIFGVLKCAYFESRLTVLRAEAERLRNEMMVAEMRRKEGIKPLTDLQAAITKAEGIWLQHHELQSAAEANLESLEEKIELARAELDKLYAEIEQLKAVKAALGGF